MGPKLKHSWIIQTPSAWLYATSSAFSLTIMCPTGTQTIRVEIGVGVINLLPKCQASSSFMLLPATLALERKAVVVNNFTTIQSFELDLSQGEQQVI